MIDSGDLQDRDAVSPDGGGMVTPAKLAADWGVHVHTVYRDIDKGALPAFRLPSGRLRIRREDARRYGRPHE